MGVKGLVRQQSFLFKLIFALSVCGLLLALVLAQGAASPVEAAYNPAPGPEFTAIADAAQSYLTSLGSFLPAGDATPGTIEADELFALMDTDHSGTLGSAGDDYRKAPTIIDVRSDSAYTSGHIPGAIFIPYKDVGKPENLARINAEIAKRDNDLVVVQCVTGHTEQVSAMVLGELGYKVKGLKWGMLSWKGGAAGYPNNTLAVNSTPVTPSTNNPYPAVAAGTTVEQAANAGAANTNGGAFTPGVFENPTSKFYVDIRSASDYSAAHVPGAINIPWQQVFAKDGATGAYPNLELIPRSKQVIVYGNTQHESTMVATALNMLGYKSTANAYSLSLRFGISGWNKNYGEIYADEQNNYPTISGSAPGGYLPAPLTVTSTDPANGAVDVAKDTDVKAVFSSAVDQSTLNGSSYYLENASGNTVSAGVSYDSTSKTATIDPVADLAEGQTYTATVSESVKGASGEAMNADKTWTFTVAAAPPPPPPPPPFDVASTDPADGAVDVAAGTNVKAVFSSAVDQYTLNGSSYYLKNSSGNTVSADVSYDSASKTATLDPVADLAEGQTYTATVSNSVKGASGEVMDDDKAWSFTVAAVTPPPPPPPPAVSVTVMTSGPVTGTQLVGLSIDGDGVATLGATESVTGGQATHGGYLAPSGDKMYINGFTGGGMQIWEKAAGSWSLTDTVPATIAKMMCSTDLKGGWEDPSTGLIQVGDISTGLNFDFNMATDDWKAKSPVGDIELGTLQGIATTCDTAYAENPRTGMGWSSGHSNNVYTWDFNTPLPLPVDPASLGLGLPEIPTLKNVRPAETVLGHQNRTFSLPDGEEYVAIFDGSAGQILIIDPDNDSEIGRITIGGEAHAMGVMVDGVQTNTLTSPYAVSSNFATGSLKVVRLYTVDQDGNYSMNVDGPGQEKVVTSEIAGVGSAADLCGIDIVGVDGSWMRN